MSHSQLTAAVTFSAAAAIALVGCGDRSRSDHSQQMSSRNQTPAADRDENRSLTYVACRATLTAYENDFPWFDDSSVGHDDGVAPLASFVLMEPATYADLSIGILFKYTADASTISPPEQADIGRHFTFEIPEDVLTDKYKTVDNLNVRYFRKTEP